MPLIADLHGLRESGTSLIVGELFCARALENI